MLYFLLPKCRIWIPMLVSSLVILKFWPCYILIENNGSWHSVCLVHFFHQVGYERIKYRHINTLDMVFMCEYVLHNIHAEKCILHVCRHWNTLITFIAWLIKSQIPHIRMTVGPYLLACIKRISCMVVVKENMYVVPKEKHIRPVSDFWLPCRLWIESIELPSKDINRPFNPILNLSCSPCRHIDIYLHYYSHLTCHDLCV